MKLDGLLPDSEDDEQLEERECFENKYYAIIAQAECILGTESVPSIVRNECRDNHDAYQAVKLPTINLPSFDGSYEQWLEFKNTYVSLVHVSNTISIIQKFHYLKSALKGPAALVINSIEFTPDNYFVAWELLMNRYNNSRLLIHNHVKALFTIQQISKESPVLLRKLIDVVLKNLRSLKLLGEPTEHWDTLIIYMVVSKLDDSTERAWEKHRSELGLGEQQKDGKVLVQVTHLLEFLKARADMLETLHVSHSKNNQDFNKFTKNSNNSPGNRDTSGNKVRCNVSTSNLDKQFKRSCPYCKDIHNLYSCQTFLDSTIDNKINFIKKNKLCVNCLRAGHGPDVCRFGPCRKCNLKHNTIIHRERSATEGQVALPLAPAQNECISDSPQCTSVQTYSSQVISGSDVKCAQASLTQPVLLSTALVRVTDDSGKTIICRVMLDSGSQCCFIRKAICDQINTPLIQSTRKIQGIGNSVTQCFQSCKINIRSLNDDYSTHVQCLVLPQITPPAPSIPINFNQIKIPHHITLADPSYLDGFDIDILIGADHFWDLLSEGKIPLASGPFLQNTKLGWVISGPINNLPVISNTILCNYTQLHSIDSQLRKFWELEEVSPGFHVQSEVERACEEDFVLNTRRDPQGRFIVKIPFSESPTLLGDSYTQAYRRLVALEKRLSRSTNCAQLYKAFIDEYISLGHMDRIHDFPTPHYFMPHFCVFNENSTTTKLRVVFDASAKSTSDKSLNDLQMVGPPIQGDLFAILLRFRENAYIACADIEKMYRQVLIDVSQRDLQLILWRSNPAAPLEIYRLNTVTYGTASAPFLSVRCLRQLAMECNDVDVKRIITHDFYVDDMITGSDDKDELLKLCEKTANVLSTGCFPLRKWVFNFKNDSLPSSHTLKDLSLGEPGIGLTYPPQSKTLGLSWISQSDQLNYQSKVRLPSTKITKRVILSTISQIFDPLGLLSPTIMTVKILLQRLWLLKTDWDTQLPEEVADEFKRFLSNLDVLSCLRIPRHTFTKHHIRAELHIFTDASQKAYGACAYIRTLTQNGSVSVRLLCAKGKVAPLKPLTVPRLELCGAVTGAKLCVKIIESLRCEFDDVTLWTDSTIVLGWLRMAPYQLKTYVQNRVVEVQEMTRNYAWYHVATQDNPADLVSRGVDLKSLEKSNLWWEGPQFFRDPNFKPRAIKTPTASKVADLPEVKVLHTQNVNPQEGQYIDPVITFSRFSQFSRIQRAMAYVKRFIHNAQSPSNKLSGALDVDELREAVNTLARLSQQESFPEYNTLRNNKPLAKRSQLMKLSVFIDENDLIRVGGRLYNASEFNYNKKHPILLSAKHPFTYLLFRYEHLRQLHAAPQLLLFTIRESWWPIGGRNLAKKVVHECIICTRLSGKTLTPIMGNLPAERLAPSFPFAVSGVDYFGPVFVLNRKGRGAKLIKAYVSLFVCFATRAIHLELVGDLSTDAYLLALKRFVSRRGKPAEIFSDNGRNFTGLMTEFSKFLANCADEIKEFAINNNIKFKFIPPYSPHFGGLWEAGVKSCKHHIRRVVGNANFTFEEFSTVLAQVEAVLNSRPLSPMSTDPNDFTPLTPAHFLVGRPLTSPACEDYEQVPAHRLTRYQRVEQARQHFWSRWSKEYVSELQVRTKWNKAGDSLKEDTLVLIKEDNNPPLKWSMGRIVAIFPGKDGVSRVASIRMANGNVVRRAFSKICPLPVTCGPNSTAPTSPTGTK
ncbi:uncharacterized protein LOC123875672 [Maniola jurtina]|uniref:uncharacterized protein LOC123875672 n=1 Tax=Maniola jurtina TaxID=191418 RepID=UPI001E68D6F0|nr:uncharacterized protein LOC123875672 [Maniola jurtina]